MRLIVIDNETGGVEEIHSLLTSTLKALDSDLNVLGVLRLYCKPNDGNYIVDAQGLEVNGINLVEHNKVAKTYKENGTILYNWLKLITDDGKNKVTPMGHGIGGDIQSLFKLLNPNTWHNFCSHNYIDTISLCKFAQFQGFIPEDQSLALGKVSGFLGVDVDESRLHDDSYDVDINIELFKRLRDF